MTSGSITIRAHRRLNTTTDGAYVFKEFSRMKSEDNTLGSRVGAMQVNLSLLCGECQPGFLPVAACESLPGLNEQVAGFCAGTVIFHFDRAGTNPAIDTTPNRLLSVGLDQVIFEELVAGPREEG